MEEGKGGKEESRVESGTCGNTTKGAARREASASCQGKGVGGREDVEEDRRKGDGARGQATKCAARMEEELSRRAKKESGRALWKRRPRRGAIVRPRVVYEGGSSFAPSLQEV